MKNSTSIILGNATTDNIQHIHFRKMNFLTESNRTHLEECIRTFITLSIPFAFHDLVQLTCYPRKDIPVRVLEEIKLNPELIPDDAWNSFVNELRYQYKITHPTFMTEYNVPDECLAAYEALVSSTSEVAAYMFYKRADTFLYDHIRSDIGLQHISNTINQLSWHSRDPEINRVKQLKGLRRLSLKEYEAIYFHNHLEKCITLLQSMKDIMQIDVMATVKKPVQVKVIDLPFVMEIPDNTVTPEPAKKSSLELTKENILKYEADFLSSVLGNNKDSLNRLKNAGFDTEKIRIKAVIIFRIICAHREMADAVEALSK